MATLVFDIETSALPLENFDEAQQEYLFREAEKLADATAKTAKRGEITKFMSLWPFTSQVVCIAMLNAETQRGQTLFVAEDFEEVEEENAPVKFIPCADETELLAQFWDVAKKYQFRRHLQRTRLRRAVHLPALGAAQRAHLQEELARLPITPPTRIATSRSNSPFTA